MWLKGEKPNILLDIPIYETDYEEINIFNWRDEVKNMISQNEFVRMVSAQSETASKYITEGKIVPERVIETGYRNFNFFKEDTLKSYAEKYNWDFETAYAIYDRFPVNKGHMLIIPKKHVKDYFETSEQDKDVLWKLVDECKKILDKKFNPDGYNIGINCSEAAGQTVMHLHIHLIPRYIGDKDNPKGGVRGVIPHKKIY